MYSPTQLFNNQQQPVYEYMRSLGRNGIKRLLAPFAVNDVIRMANGCSIQKTGKKSWEFWNE